MLNYTDADYQPGTLIHHHPEYLYRKSPGESATQIKVFGNRSPAHYRYQFRGEPVIRSESEAMVLGSMVHCLVLEPQHFDRRYQAQPQPEEHHLVTVPQLKQWLKAHHLNQAGQKSELIERIMQHDPDAPVWLILEEKRRQSRCKTVKPELICQAQAMADCVLNCPDARQLFSHGDAEVSVWGQHENTGLLTKCRPDWLRDGVCVDLKTCACANPQKFSSDFVRLGYDLQQAHYLNTLNSAGIQVEVFAFIAVESEPPYLTQVYMLDSKHATMAVRRWHQVMCDLYECQQQDRWPGYTDEIELPLPGWYARQYGDLT